MHRRDVVRVIPLLALAAGLGWFALGRTKPAVSIGDGTLEEAGDGASPVAEGVDGAGALASGGQVKPKPAPKDPDAAPVTPTFSKAEGVFGRVADARATPVPGAKLTLLRVDPTLANWWQSDGEIVSTADAAADGTFLVGPVAVGAFKWRLRCEASGFARTGVEISARGSRIDFYLDRGGAIRIRVKDETGTAIAKAAVRAGEDSPLTRSVGTTDATGEVRLDGLPLGGVEVSAECLGYGSSYSNDVVVSAATTVEKTIVLRAAIQLSGRVTEETTNNPVPGATVTAITAQSGPTAPVATATTDSDGRFTISATGRAGGSVEVTARKEGLGAATTSVQLQAAAQGPAGPPRGGGSEVLLRLGKSPGIAGTVVDAESGPAANAMVVFSNTAGERGLGESSARTDAEGRFTLDVPPGTNRDGTYTLAAYSATKGLGTLTYTPNRTPSPTIRLLGAGVILGTIKGPDGAPAEGAVLSFWIDQSRRQELPTATAEFQPWQYQQALYDPRLATIGAATDTEGRFRIEGVPMGGYVGWITWRGTSLSTSTPISVRPGGTATLDVTLKNGGVIEGRVIDGDSKPIAGASISGWDPQNNQPGENRYAQARSDADGRFVLRGVLGENWSVQASATGFLDASLPAVRSGDTAVEIRLTPLGWIDGVVLGPDGKPWSGPFSASATGAGEGEEETGEASGEFAAADGAFRLRGLTQGSYVVSATTNEGLVPSATARTTVVNGSGSGPVEIRLVRGASISGTVLEDGSRRALASANVAVRIRGEATSGGQTNAWSQTDAKGRFSVVGLAAGTYAVAVSDGGGGSVDELVPLDAGQSVDREFLTRRPGAIAIRVVDADGRPIAKVRINLQSEGGNYISPNWDALQKEGKVDFSRGGWESAISTNDEGLLTRWHVPPGRVRVMARPRGVPFTHEPVTVEVASERTTEVTITANPTASGDTGGR